MRYRTPRRLSAGAAAVAFTLSGLAATTAPASAVEPSAQTTCNGVIAMSSESGAPLGFVGYANRTYGATSSRAAAATFSLTFGSRQNIVDVAAPAATPNMGLAAGNSGARLAPGSAGYALMTRTSTTSPGAAPSAGSNALFSSGSVESAVWSLDEATGAVVPTWINADGSTASAIFYTNNNILGVSGDIAATDAAYPETLTPVRLTASCNQASQAIDFTSSAPSPGRVDDTYDVTTTGGRSGNPVTLSSGTPDVCTVQAARVTFLTEGTCTVLADQQGNQDYLAAKQASQTITVAKRAQTLTFGSTAPSSAYVGQSYQASASSDSALPVTLGSGTPEVCTVDPDGLVTFVAAGRCTVQADQEGGRAHQAATRTSQSFVVDQITPLVTVTAPTGTVSGESVRVSASLSVPEDAPGTIPAGTVQFSADGTDLGDPVVVSDGGAESPVFARGAGDHAVSARFVPTDTTTYGAATGAGTLGVAQAPTTTAVSVTGSDLRAVVSTDAPGVGTPTGTVSFLVAGEEVGRASLTNGVAVLPYDLAAGQSRNVSAAYLGDDDRAGSVDSLTREDPRITAAQSSSTPRTAAGWYRTPVRVDYTCSTATAALAASCPASDTVSEEGAGTTVTRTVSAVDGGIGSVTSTVNLDRTAPTVSLRGVTAGKRYFAEAPEATCVGADVLSGLDSCTVSTTRGRDGAETVTATATDKAGNVARTSTSYVVVRYAVAGADYVNGAWVVRRGTGINVLAQTTGTPTYRLASTSPANLSKAGTRKMVRTGKDTWAYGATVNMVRTPNGIWYLGVQTGRTITPVKIRMIG